MVLEMDNSRAVDIANSWSVYGRMWHEDVCNYFLCELKDQGMLIIRQIPRDSTEADVFTKNVASVMFNCYVPLCLKIIEKIQVHEQVLSSKTISVIFALKLVME